MKKYKLIKDLPEIPTGYTVKRSEDGTRSLNGTQSLHNRSDMEASDFMSSLLEKSLKEGGRLKEIKENDTTYNGMCFNEEKRKFKSMTFMEFADNNSREKWDKKLQAIKAIRKWQAENDGDFEPDWSDDEHKYRLYYCNRNKKWGADLTSTSEDQFLLPCFSSAEKAHKCVFDLRDILNDLLYR